MCYTTVKEMEKRELNVKTNSTDYLCVHTAKIKRNRERAKNKPKERIFSAAVAVVGNYALFHFRLVFGCDVCVRAFSFDFFVLHF